MLTLLRSSTQKILKPFGVSEGLWNLRQKCEVMSSLPTFPPDQIAVYHDRGCPWTFWTPRRWQSLERTCPCRSVLWRKKWMDVIWCDGWVLLRDLSRKVLCHVVCESFPWLFRFLFEQNSIDMSCQKACWLRLRLGASLSGTSFRKVIIYFEPTLVEDDRCRMVLRRILLDGVSTNLRAHCIDRVSSKPIPQGGYESFVPKQNQSPPGSTENSLFLSPWKPGITSPFRAL